jgi:hypothetical protein
MLRWLNLCDGLPHPSWPASCQALKELCYCHRRMGAALGSSAKPRPMHSRSRLRVSRAIVKSKSERSAIR